MAEFARGQERSYSAESTEPEMSGETLLPPGDDCGPSEPSAPEERTIGDGYLAAGKLLDDYEIG
jgi:hypothetical protein